MADSSTRLLVLVGLMGAGKSSSGQALAERVGLGFFDLDAAIEERTAMTVAELFDEVGEAGFRQLEHEALIGVLCRDSTVVATGGGIVLRTDNRVALDTSGAQVVWLRGRPETLARRVAGDSGRPLLAASDPVVVLTELNEIRSGLYAAVADDIIDVDDMSPAAVVDELERVIGVAS